MAVIRNRRGPRRSASSPRSEPRPPRSRLLTAIFLTLTLAIIIVIAVTWVGLWLLHVHYFKQEPVLSADSFYNLLKVALAVAAGTGGAVALVTAYRRQRINETAEHRDKTRLFNERFTAAAEQLGHDAPAIRLAGIYAMARLADDWPDQRQTCVHVLCAYLRMPYKPQPPDDASQDDRLTWQAERQVHHTVIRVITAHLRPDATRLPSDGPWHGLNFDFTGVIFGGGNFSGARFADSTVTFDRAQFPGGLVSFTAADFASGTVTFDRAQFNGGPVSFDNAQFSGGTVSFLGAQFTHGAVVFDNARFTGGAVSFAAAQFTSPKGTPSSVEETPGIVSFTGAVFSGGTVDFTDARFTGGLVAFAGARFTGGTVDFRNVTDWSTYPSFPRENPPPQGLLLPDRTVLPWPTPTSP